MGFRATDEDDDEPTPEVRDGHSCSDDRTPAELNAAFVSLCRSLRDMGCVEVRAGEFRAVWPCPAQPAPQLSVVPVVREKPKPERPAEPERLLPTDTADDLSRRERYREIQRSIQGDQ